MNPFCNGRRASNSNQNAASAGSSGGRGGQPSGQGVLNDFNLLFDLPRFNLAGLQRPFEGGSFPNLFRGGGPLFGQPTAGAGAGSAMVDACDSCSSRFGLFKRRKICNSCGLEYCAACMNRETHIESRWLKQRCLKCRVFALRPPVRGQLLMLRVKELRWFLQTKRIPANYCKEKSDLVDLIIQCMQPDGSVRAPPRPSRPNAVDPSSGNTASGSGTGPTAGDHGSSSSTSNSSPAAGTPLSTPSNDSSTIGSDWVIINDRPQPPGSSRRDESPDSNHGERSQDRPGVSERLADLRPCDDPGELAGGGRGRRPVPPVVGSLPNVDLLNPHDSLSDLAAGGLSKSTESLSNFKPFNIEDMRSEEEIRELSVRQLKLVLTRNYVNYKGCCEKEELQDKTIRLWRQVCQDKQLGDNVPDEEICKICMEQPINCVLLECGHYVSCIDCGKRLSECPMCRQYVVRALRIFKS